MGHKVKLEGSYERYEESDFERFPEYQKAIPYLTIDDNLRNELKIQEMARQNTELEISNQNNKKLSEELQQEKARNDLIALKQHTAIVILYQKPTIKN